MRLFFDSDEQDWRRSPVGLPAGIVQNNCVMPMPIVIRLPGGETEPAWCLNGELIDRGERAPDPICWKPFPPEKIMDIMATLKELGAV